MPIDGDLGRMETVVAAGRRREGNSTAVGGCCKDRNEAGVKLGVLMDLINGEENGEDIGARKADCSFGGGVSAGGGKNGSAADSRNRSLCNSSRKLGVLEDRVKIDGDVGAVVLKEIDIEGVGAERMGAEGVSAG